VVSSLAKVAETKEKSAHPVLADTKSKGAAEIDEAKKAIEGDISMGEGPFDQEFGGQNYRVHYSAGKEMGVKQMAEALALLNNWDTICDP
jgi:hypothetical protein